MTKPPLAGSPDAMPSENGLALNCASADVTAGDETVAASPAPAFRKGAAIHDHDCPLWVEPRHIASVSYQAEHKGAHRNTLRLQEPFRLSAGTETGANKLLPLAG